ncbi:MAG: ABC transporter ATP-binding protein [Janthinobacterium lividum]
MNVFTGIFKIGSAQRPDSLRMIERRYAAFVPLAILLGLLTSGFEGVGIGMLTPLLAQISGSSDTAQQPAFARELQHVAALLSPGQPILPLLGMALAFVLLKAATQIANSTMISYVEENAGDDIRTALAEKMLSLDYGFFLHQDPARLITIIDTDSWKATEAVRVVLVNYVARTAALLFAFLLVITDWRLSLIVATGVGLSRLVSRRLQHGLQRLGEAIVETNRLLGEQMIHAVRATRIIRVFGQEKRESAVFSLRSAEVRQAMFASDREAARCGPVIEIILATSILAVLFALDGLGTSVAQAATFLVLLYRAQIPVLTVSNSSLRLASLHGSINEIEWLLGIPIGAGSAAVPRSVPPADLPNLPICFDRVCFSYPNTTDDGLPALRDVDLLFPPHAITALIGDSGSGKSTVLNLACRLLQPSSGTIWIGERPLAAIDPALWRLRIGLAGQDTDLITGTVAQNIAYGVPDASQEDIAQAARLADAESFIERLPQGYATPLGAVGFGLSGGQRQRIGIARAILRRPELLILDEATSAIDRTAELTIMGNLTRLRPFGRAIVVSHDPRTLSHCEFGIVMSPNGIVETGPLTELDWYRNVLSKAEPLI